MGLVGVFHLPTLIDGFLPVPRQFLFTFIILFHFEATNV